MAKAVAVDLGASSGRFAVGTLHEGIITTEVIEQIPHQAIEHDGRHEWDLETILGLCQRAAAYAESLGEPVTLGIDSWGVDLGFIGKDGKLLGTPVCYRDLSHLAAFESIAELRPRLYALTGIQHQPFNTICQLIARRTDDPSLPERAADWMILPDLLGYLLSGEPHHEQTQASTTQLMGLDGRWSAEAFEIAGWPVPERQPAQPGTLGPEFRPGVRLAHVGSHDTASAVAGFGALPDDTLFVNVGTWSLAGCVLDRPLATPEAEAARFTNEWTVDGRVRFLKNIAGFYVINRLHEELGITATVPRWLDALTPVSATADLMHPDLYNPESMVRTIAEIAGFSPATEAEWAGLAMGSLVWTVAQLPAEIASVTGRTTRTIRVGGGGSQSVHFCQGLADLTRCEVVAGPVEATVVGNLAVQFLAQGAFSSREEMEAVVSASAPRVTYRPC